MNILVVYAHPNPNSFNAAIFQHARDCLTEAGHTLHCIDLYEESFEAVMSREERERYMTINNTQGIEHHVARLRWAEALVLIYPMWWMEPPAILKGWFDRIWLPGVAATFRGGKVKPELTNIRKITVINTQGASWWRMALIGNPPHIMLKLMMKAVARCRHFQWLTLYRMEKNTEHDRVKFFNKVSRKLSRL